MDTTTLPDVVTSTAPTVKWWRRHLPALAALGLFAAFAGVVLSRSTALLEPDDYAYRASIVALTQGHLTLSNSEYQALATSLSHGRTGPLSGQGILQWVQLSNGRWISEKNPGYPFLAAPFQLLGILRLAPLVYGALGALALFFGARRWLGKWGGTYAVATFLASGAAIVFAWRATMPTFTGASLIAAGLGALLWTWLATDRSPRRRITIGLLGFLALEAATAVRYTDVVFLIVATLATMIINRRVNLPRRALGWWLGSVATFGTLVLVFDQLVYGNAFKTGYSSGEITFSLASVSPNLHHMPIQLIKWMPASLLALAALVWVIVRWMSTRRSLDLANRRRSVRDLAIAGWLAAGWLSLWALYSAYDWTARMSGVGQDSSMHVIRFYVPAIGAMALLGAWLLSRLPRWFPAVALAGVIGAGAVAHPTMTNGAEGIGGPGGAPGVGGPGSGPGPNGQLPGNGQLPPNGQLPGGPPTGTGTAAPGV